MRTGMPPLSAIAASRRRLPHCRSSTPSSAASEKTDTSRAAAANAQIDRMRSSGSTSKPYTSTSRRVTRGVEANSACAMRSMSRLSEKSSPASACIRRYTNAMSRSFFCMPPAAPSASRSISSGAMPSLLSDAMSSAARMCKEGSRLSSTKSSPAHPAKANFASMAKPDASSVCTARPPESAATRSVSFSKLSTSRSKNPSRPSLSKIPRSVRKLACAGTITIACPPWESTCRTRA